MPTFGDRLRRAREDAGLTQGELADRAGMGPGGRSHVAKIERGLDVQRPRYPTVRKLADALGVEPRALLGEEPPASLTTKPTTVREAPPTYAAGEFEIIDPQRRLIGMPVEAYVAAGHGGWDEATKGETVSVPSFLLGPNDFVVRSVGESMIDEGINHGDYLIIERRPNGIAAHGELVVAWLNDGLVIKRWFRRGGRKFLESANESMGWKPREVTPDDVFEIQGVVRHILKNPKRIS